MTIPELVQISPTLGSDGLMYSGKSLKAMSNVVLKASLSEPHTSVDSLHAFVCKFACLFVCLD